MICKIWRSVKIFLSRKPQLYPGNAAVGFADCLIPCKPASVMETKQESYQSKQILTESNDHQSCRDSKRQRPAIGIKTVHRACKSTHMVKNQNSTQSLQKHTRG